MAATITLGFFGFAAWYLASQQYWVGACLFAAGVAVALRRLLPFLTRSRRKPLLSVVTLQPVVVIALGLTLGVCEIGGFGFRRDVGRGVVALLGVAVVSYGLLVLRRGLSSHEEGDEPNEL
jgi:hypothetical protein